MSISFFGTVAALCADLALSGAVALQPALSLDETAATTTSDTILLAEAVPQTDTSLPPPAVTEDVPTAEVQSLLAFADLSDEEITDKVVDYFLSMDTLTADFAQIGQSGSANSGQLYLRRPGQLRFDYNAPSSLLIVATQGNVYVREEEQDTTDFYPISSTPLRFLLGKKPDFAEADVMAVDRGEDSVAVTFAAPDSDFEGELSVILDAPTLRLRQWIVRDFQNGTTVVTLNNVKTGEKLPNKLFRVPDAGGDFLKN